MCVSQNHYIYVTLWWQLTIKMLALVPCRHSEKTLQRPRNNNKKIRMDLCKDLGIIKIHRKNKDGITVHHYSITVTALILLKTFANKFNRVWFNDLWFTNHILAERKHLANHTEWIEHKIMVFKPENKHQMICNVIISKTWFPDIYFFIQQMVSKYYFLQSWNNVQQKCTRDT